MVQSRMIDRRLTGTGLGAGMRAGLLALALATAACGTSALRGNLVEDRHLSQLQEGVSTTDDVIAALGPPTARATFDEGIWYYIGERTEQFAFLSPEVVERRVVRVQFDGQGRVASLQQLTLDDAREFALVSRETPTLGRELGLLEQLFGNIGRFDAGGAVDTIGTRGTGI
ncbi:MAG: outer membrane protein assembly factor BamE [Azospirillaceae bacterium]